MVFLPILLLIELALAGKSPNGQKAPSNVQEAIFSFPLKAEKDRSILCLAVSSPNGKYTYRDIGKMSDPDTKVVNILKRSSMKRFRTLSECLIRTQPTKNAIPIGDQYVFGHLFVITNIRIVSPDRVLAKTRYYFDKDSFAYNLWEVTRLNSVWNAQTINREFDSN